MLIFSEVNQRVNYLWGTNIKRAFEKVQGINIRQGQSDKI